MADEKDKGEGEKGTAGTAERDAQIAAQVDAAIAKGEARGMLLDLRTENAGYREKIRELKAKLPADGAIVLTGDDAANWSKYREIGAPADLRKAVAERDAFRDENQRHARALKVREVADLLYPGKARVLDMVLAGVETEVIEVAGKDGKVARVPHVKAAKEGDKPVPVADWIAANHADLLPALASKPAEPARPFNGPPARPQSGPARPPADPQLTIAQETRRLGDYGRM